MTNQKIKCIAIDDEPVALDIISGYINKIPFLELIKTYRNALHAIEYLQNNHVDLIFLDINMPEVNGIDFIKSLDTKCKVIFTTAYAEFAVISYELNALDYLLKPISFERFLKAVNKIHSSHNLKPKTTIINNDYIFLKSGLKSYKIKPNEIIYIEGSGNYLTVHTLEKKIMVLMSMNEIIGILPELDFSRVHKSYIVSLKHIKVIESYQIQINEIKIPIGKYYKESFFKKVNR